MYDICFSFLIYTLYWLCIKITNDILIFLWFSQNIQKTKIDEEFLEDSAAHARRANDPDAHLYEPNM